MKNIRCIAPAMLLFFVAVSARGVSSAQPSQAKATSWALEIVYPGKAAEYLPVPAGTTTLHPDPLPTWQPNATLQFPPHVMAVCGLQDESVRVCLTATLGLFSDRKTWPLGDFLLQEGEAVMVNAAASFGRVPFQIKVVRVKPFAVTPLTVENRTASLEVVSVVPAEATFPSYKLTLRNGSEKNVVAFNYSLLKSDGRPFIGAGQQGSQGRPLIKPGGLFELVTYNTPLATNSESNGRMTAQGLIPANLSRMMIRAVIFDDGSSEGDPGPAAELKTVARGRLIQLSRLNAILEVESLGFAAYEMADLERLRRSVIALSEEADDAVIAETLTRWTLAPIIGRKPDERSRELVKSGLYDVKRSFLDESGAVSRQKSAEAVRAWLPEAKRRFAEWASATARFIE